MATTRVTVGSGGDYATIALAMAATSSGSGPTDMSTITIIDNATYAEAVTFASVQYVRLQALATKAPTIHPTSGAAIILTGTSANIEVLGDSATHRLGITAGLSAGTPHVSLSAVGQSVKVTNATITNTGTSGTGIIAKDGAGLHTGAVEFVDCVAVGNFYNLFGYSSAGAAGFSNLTLTRCDFSAVTGAEVAFKGNSWGWNFTRCRFAATRFVQPVSPTVTFTALHMDNCVFTRTSGTAAALLIDTFSGAGNVELWNCLMLGASGTAKALDFKGGVAAADIDLRNTGFVGWGAGAVTTANAYTVENCGFYGNTSNVSGSASVGTSCEITDPLFVGSGDYHLTCEFGAVSPWINAGAATGLTLDLDGLPTPSGTAPDIGPYEYQFANVEMTEAASISTALLVAFTVQPDPATLGAGGDWTIAGMTSPPTILTVAANPTQPTVVDLTLSDNLDDGATITCPATLADAAGNVIDPAHDTVTVAVENDPPPSLTGTDPNATTLHVTPNGEAQDEPWSPLPDDVDDADELTDRMLQTCLGTDRAATATDVIATVPSGVTYKGGCWADYFVADRFDSRLWMCRGQPATVDTASRAAQYVREDLAPFVAGGYLTDAQARAAVEGEQLSILTDAAVE